MTRQSVHDGARAWGIHGDLTDGTSPRAFEDAIAGAGLGILSQALISNQINIVGGIDAAILTIPVDTSVGGGLTTTANTCYCEGEQITYSGIAAGVMTVVVGGRGTGGTTAATHADNAVITQNPPLPTGHRTWMVHVPASAALLRYDCDSTVLPIAVTGGMFAAVVRYLWFSGTPTASVNQFLGAIGLSSGSATQFQRWLRLRTDLKIDMITSDIPPRVYDTSVGTLPRNTLMSAVITVETDRPGGFIRYKFYYSTDGGATFTIMTWNTAGTAASVTATTLTVTPDIWATDVHIGRVVTMGGVSATITSNTATVLTFSGGWSAGTPAAGAYTFDTVDYVDGSVSSIVGGTLQAFTVGLFAPTADPALDNGIKTYVSEVGVVHSSEYLGAYPTGFAIGKFAPNFDVVGWVEWQPNSGTDHFAAVNKEIGSGGGGIKVSETVANQQEIFGYESSDTTNIPAANTPLVAKAWANLRASTSLPDSVNLTHLVNDNGSMYTYASVDTVAVGDKKSSVSLRSMPGGGGRWTTTRIDAFEAGLDKVGDDTLNYNCFQHFLMVLSISNPASIAGLAFQRSRVMRPLLGR